MFGQDILDGNGKIDRRVLGSKVFTDKVLGSKVFTYKVLVSKVFIDKMLGSNIFTDNVLGSKVFTDEVLLKKVSKWTSHDPSGRSHKGQRRLCLKMAAFIMSVC